MEPRSSIQLHGREEPGPDAPFQINGEEDIEQNPMRRNFPDPEKEQLHTSDKIDAVCFIVLLTCYVMFVSIFMYSFLYMWNI